MLKQRGCCKITDFCNKWFKRQANACPILQKCCICSILFIAKACLSKSLDFQTRSKVNQNTTPPSTFSAPHSL